MNSEFLSYIRHLSKQDRKSLSQKALKACEEVGELARVVLPFENAYATTHRFTEREAILEEAVDTVLCALSVAYDLNFSDEDVEEMFNRKAEKWALLQSKEANVSYPLPYEIHVTVKYEPSGVVFIQDFIDGFKLLCRGIDVKPIVLDLEGKNGDVTSIDVMTSSKHFGTNASAYEHAMNIRHALRAGGYNVVRVKIETVPWHPAAPVGEQPMPPNCYFESHLPVTLLPSEVDALRASVAQMTAKLHVSRNKFKTLDDGRIVQMVTMRSASGTYEEFQQQLEPVVRSLSQSWSIGKVITEFAIYDTNVSHDHSWIKSS